MPEMLGTLLPLSAIGSFAKGHTFIKWLAKTHQQAWQFLPLHPTASASPYNSFGVGLNPDFVILPKKLPEDPEFVSEQQDWIVDYSLFMALAEHFGSSNWTSWPMPVRHHQDLKPWTIKLAANINYQQNVQAYLHRTFAKLHSFAQEQKIKLIGDLPFYLTRNSPLVWANQQAFLIDHSGNLPFVSGVVGGEYYPRQVWNHPLYHYEHLSSILSLWNIRVSYANSLYDLIRLDSGISFYTYNKIHPTDPNLDQTVSGPGDQILEPILSTCQRLKLPIFMENVTEYDLRPLQRLMSQFHVPGVGIYALNPDKFIGPDLDPATIYYSSNHDTPTLVEYMGSAEEARAIRDRLLESCKHLILPLQDWQLSSERINYPGTPDANNWHYKVDLSKLKAP